MVSNTSKYENTSFKLVGFPAFIPYLSSLRNEITVFSVFFFSVLVFMFYFFID